MTSAPFLRIGQQSISLTQAIQYLQRGEAFERCVGEIVRQYVLDQALTQQRYPTVDNARVDQAIAHFRQQQQLSDPAAFQQWLASADVTYDQFYNQTRAGLQIEALKAAIALPKLQQYFIERKLYLDRVVLSRIIVEDKDMAEELRHQVLDKQTSFEALAQDYSITDDRIVNGMVGPVSRGTMPDALRAIVDDATVGELVGPITMDQRWGLFRIEALLPASLDDDVLRQALIDELFEQWLAAKIEALPIQLQITP
ncbi:MAG: peptidylprolyl isomerase [Elainellaceae cyanobacterium]